MGMTSSCGDHAGLLWYSLSNPTISPFEICSCPSRDPLLDSDQVVLVQLSAHPASTHPCGLIPFLAPIYLVHLRWWISSGPPIGRSLWGSPWEMLPPRSCVWECPPSKLAAEGNPWLPGRSLACPLPGRCSIAQVIRALVLPCFLTGPYPFGPLWL